MPQRTFNFNRNTGFAGPCFDPALDADRLSTQLGRVYNVMRYGGWWTLKAIHCATGDPEASISAQIRHLRKPKFGSYNVERRRAPHEAGLWQYRIDRKETP